MKRTSGILMHISSLPNKYGIGTFGKEAYDFVDFLNNSHISIWQILPLNLTSYGDSAYQSPSNYGFNYYFIDLDTLKEQGLLKLEDYNNVDFGNNEEKVNYEKIFNNRIVILKKAFNNFKYNKEFLNFLDTNKNARDFAFFMVLKELNNYQPWYNWNDDLRNYSKEIEDEVINNNKKLYDFYMWTQFEFLNQYYKLKKYANDKGVKIMGDIPIYLA